MLFDAAVDPQKALDARAAINAALIAAAATFLAAVAGGAVASRGGARLERQRQWREDRKEWREALSHLDKQVDLAVEQSEEQAYSTVFELLTDMKYMAHDQGTRQLVNDMQAAVDAFYSRPKGRHDVVYEGSLRYNAVYEALDRLAAGVLYNPPRARP